MSADLHSGLMRGGHKDFRLPKTFFHETPVPDSLKTLWKWMKSIRKPDDVIVVFDGRFAKVRRFFDAEIAQLGQSFEMWIIYKTPGSNAHH